MKCHYEVLGVSRDVADDELKKNYRKLALKWHPDKNLDNSEEAKEQFQIIQQAFEVLSDPQERAWYDAHREAILKGGLGGDFKDESFDVFPYFTTSCYKGYGDDEKGFYTIYKEVFSKISSEETEFHDENSDSDFEIPSFGDSTSNYEEVVHTFYAFWQSFSTRKSYAWLDQYDTRQAENRRVVRAMEKENKKFRDKARKERNEQVRALVAFVRKRDKRVEQYRVKLAEKAKENAIKAENSRKRQLAERRKVLEEYKDPECLKMENMEGVLKEMESQLAAEFGESCSDTGASDSEEEEAPTGLFCVACNKSFKTDKAFANHENSKKHKESVAALKSFMQEEEESAETVDGAEGDTVVNDLSDIGTADLSVSSEEEMKAPKKNKKNKKKAVVEVLSSDAGSEASLDLEDVGISKKQRRKKGKHRAESQDCDVPPVGEDIDADQEGQEASLPPASKSKGKRAKAAKQAAANKQVDASSTSTAPPVDTSLTCVKCNSNFQSRNKLFEHFKKTGHSVPISNAASIPSKGSEKKKRK